ncbi:pantoate--beta-alanine ligase [Fodinicurvata sp. EGI_FJ10296]|uniref:pantoate--beta-alanine ligase n=1 Tax=Fodinicurvata sp. EGI_FJ10296 TaxID=3231908 RepID=UPI0034511624
MTIPVVHNVAELRAMTAPWRDRKAIVAIVPTMGALHDGHLSLVRAALDRADRVIVSIFVNPKQFDRSDDLAAYPRTLDNDLAALQSVGPHLVFAPTAEAVYPSDFSTTVSVAGPGCDLCGAQRPGHFDGVSTVVAKLFLQSGADLAFFGEKDYQQLLVVRRMVRDLDIPIEVIGCPTIREADGLALSSRNARLSPGDRRIAPSLVRHLRAAGDRIAAGDAVETVLSDSKAALIAEGFRKVDYVECRSADDLRVPARFPGPPNSPVRLLAAAWLGDVRLIDNLAVAPPADEPAA